MQNLGPEGPLGFYQKIFSNVFAEPVEINQSCQVDLKVMFCKCSAVYRLLDPLRLSYVSTENALLSYNATTRFHQNLPIQWPFY